MQRNIQPKEFEDVGRQLEPGQRTRIPHDCGEGNAMIVSRDDHCIRAFCFRCKETGYISFQLSAKERIAKLLENQNADEAWQDAVVLPKPMVTHVEDWPKYAKTWLFKAGFDADWIDRLGWYYHREMDRVVMPVWEGDLAVYWQARGFDRNRPKYLNPKVDRSRLLAFYGDKQDGNLVLTEDILSAAKVGRSFDSASLLGTYMSDGMLVRLLQLGLRRVVVSLDPDDPGIVGARKVHEQLQMVGIDSRICILHADPKMCSRKEIEDAFLREFE